VEDICRRLDGIPLAIELAAARVVAMSPAEILGLLGERLRLLTGGRRTAVERHQTLRATVDWSYSLLRPTEQVVFARLGVFPASFDAAAARAVAGGEGVEVAESSAVGPTEAAAASVVGAPVGSSNTSIVGSSLILHCPPRTVRDNVRPLGRHGPGRQRRPNLPIVASATRTERAHRTSLDDGHQTRHIGTYGA
jgi:hypothetical protein